MSDDGARLEELAQSVLGPLVCGGTIVPLLKLLRIKAGAQGDHVHDNPATYVPVVTHDLYIDEPGTLHDPLKDEDETVVGLSILRGVPKGVQDRASILTRNRSDGLLGQCAAKISTVGFVNGGSYLNSRDELWG